MGNVGITRAPILGTWKLAGFAISGVCWRCFFLKNLQDWKKLGRKKSHGRCFFCCIMFTGFWFFTLRIRKPLNPVPSFWKPKHPCYTSSFTLPLEDPGILRARNLEEICSHVSYLVHIQVSWIIISCKRRSLRTHHTTGPFTRGFFHGGERDMALVVATDVDGTAAGRLRIHPGHGKNQLKRNWFCTFFVEG